MTTEVVPRQPIEVLKTGLVFSPDCTLADWAKKGEELSRIIQLTSENLSWWVGDFIVYGDKFRQSDRYSQVLDKWLYEYGYLRNIVYTCRNVPHENRNQNLSFGHHVAVAQLDHQKQKDILLIAEVDHLTVRQMRALISGKPISKITIPDRVENPRVISEVTIPASLEAFDRWWEKNGATFEKFAKETPGWREVAEYVWMQATKGE